MMMPCTYQHGVNNEDAFCKFLEVKLRDGRKISSSQRRTPTSESDLSHTAN